MNTPTVEEPHLDVHQLLITCLENGWKNYRLELKRCRNEFSNEAVHDLRVSTRRVLALVELLNSISPRPRLQKMTRIFKEQLNELDELRDVQVMLADISEILQELPQLQTFQKYLQYIEEKSKRTVRRQIKKFETIEIARRIRKTRETLRSGEHEDLRSQVLEIVDDAFLLAKIRLGWVDVARPTTIHHVRIAFQSFRYLVEIIHPLLTAFPRETLKRINDYQSHMGEIRYAEVFIQTFAEFSEYTSLPNSQPVHRYYELRHAEAISAYAENRNELYTFWRPAQDQPFPWEKQHENLPDPS